MGRHAFLIAIAIAVVNFVAFVIVAQMIGGDAVNGGYVNGHFYVSSHGKRTEVSKAVYTYSLWHARSLFITHPLALLAGWLWHRNRPSS